MKPTRRKLMWLSGGLLALGLGCLAQAQVPMTGAGKGTPGAVSTLTLRLQLDASNSGSVTQAAGLVSQWNDLSASGFNVAQATALNQPFYPGATQNGLNTMAFGIAGATTFLDNATVVINQSMLICAVLQSNTSGAPSFLYDDVNGTNRVVWLANDGTGSQAVFAGNTNVTTTTNLDLTWAVVCALVNGASTAIYVNGAQEATGNAGSNNFSSLRLGSRFSATVPLIGNLGELRIYTGATGSDVSGITTTLRSKWGI